MNINIPVLHYGIAIAGLKGISLLMLPIVTGFLSPQEYGTLNFLVSISAMLSIFLGFGMAEVMFRFTAKCSGLALDVFIVQCLKFTLLISGVFILVAAFAGEPFLVLLPLAIEPEYFYLLVLTLAFTTIQAAYLTRYRVLQQSKAYMYVALTQGGAQALLTYTLLKLEFGILGVLLSGTVSSALVTTCVVIRNRRLLSIKAPRLHSKHIRYGGYIALSALCVYGLGGAENWFIASKLGASQLAYYFIATQFALALSLAFEPFRLWWFPIRFNRFFADPALAARGAVIGCFIMSMLALLMMMLAPVIIHWLLDEQYHQSSEFVSTLCILLVIKTYAELLNLGCYLDSNARWVPIINAVCAGITLCSIALLINAYAINGVFAGLLFGHSLRLLLFLIISQRMTYLSYDYGLIAVGFSLLVIQFAIAGNSVWLNLVLLAIATSISVLLGFKSKRLRRYQKVGEAV